VSIWFSKFANRLLPELDVPEVDVPVLDVPELDAPVLDDPDDELGLEEVGAPLEKSMSTIVKLSSVIVVPEPALAPLDADELAVDPSP